MSSHIIGIDLGTTYSCVGAFKNGRVEIFANEAGDRTTASVVAFVGEERLVGPSAVNQMNSNPENTVYGIKRLIGRDYENENVLRDISNWPFKVTKCASGSRGCEIVVTCQGQEKRFRPEQISGMVLGKMKSTAESALGCTIKDAIVTVPAYFDDAQRSATKDAGKLADLNVLRTINEPTAAAMAYGLHKLDEQLVLVFDMGGGTFDVSLIQLDSGIFQVIAAHGDNHLGGEDFDIRMVQYCVNQFKMKTGIDLSKMVKPMRRLKTACERQKRALSSSSSVVIDVESIAEGHDLSVPITRAKFDSLCADLFNKSIECVSACLQKGKKDKSEVSQVVLVGGSTRILKVQELLSNYFNGKELNKSVNPDEAVAYGAAIQGAILSPDRPDEVKDVLLVDVCPLALGVKVHNGTMAVVVPANTTIPTSKNETFTTYADNQDSVSIEIYNGNRTMAKDNNLLGVFQLTGIAPAPRGIPQIEVKFDVDASGMLLVTAVDKATGKESKITVSGKGGLDADAIKRMKEDAIKYEAQDKKIKEYIDELNSLESLCTNCISSCNNTEIASKLSQSEIDSVKTLSSEIESWLTGVARSLPPDEGKPLCDQKKKQLEGLWHPLYTKISGATPGGMPGQQPGAGFGGFGGPSAPGSGPTSSGPTIEEVD